MNLKSSKWATVFFGSEGDTSRCVKQMRHQSKKNVGRNSFFLEQESAVNDNVTFRSIKKPVTTHGRLVLPSGLLRHTENLELCEPEPQRASLLRDSAVSSVIFGEFSFVLSSFFYIMEKIFLKVFSILIQSISYFVLFCFLHVDVRFFKTKFYKSCFDEQYVESDGAK